MRMAGECEVHLYPEPWYVNQRFAVNIIHKAPGVSGFQKVSVATKVEFTPVDPHCDRVEPALNIERAAAQKLLDQLWEAGLRPTAEIGSAGERKALERHLNDMRTLVEGALDVKLR